ncbi:hypothetical protein EDEG_02566 [Edhazardia aedis USNM 41457]|uniref:Uncharacterized protein n=1 Tax=Edhazardia aedis (strain USNM 41457) TaxID=1003232 RepID=J9DNX7_EDHAE|nr:hypothetical protein EDEG_02566 [Edhazardia aedis USNM 41457]|eukprot:EJW03047.1 hypothetical protein EDEG_02566 [Edhazardia aedis USNM 41457]
MELQELYIILLVTYKKMTVNLIASTTIVKKYVLYSFHLPQTSVSEIANKRIYSPTIKYYISNFLLFKKLLKLIFFGILLIDKNYLRNNLFRFWFSIFYKII